ncbi:flavodoxin family protein [Desulfomonile tiedjei]|uniref:Multimeric flavodoxin WrbA n=1 Tax=Desulfomonile tiedjei (strain ATCC 49306 / DSM 6799 / DCB-1) TaxID=706587 RepID=I4C9F0_DESTA|nr:flavodoxin family protein [Desulfomonile tiedjei]AFM26191.1 multimeric flavodoxin WrbA [Desulfomonile tiedjei DSM 6799]
MKVAAFSGSARKDGNTAILIGHVFRELEKEGVETELFQLAGKEIRGCMACYKCWGKKNQRCTNEKDVVNDYIAVMLEVEGIILASPTYFTDVSSEMKALIDRVGMVSRANENMFKRKVGAAVSVQRRGGAIHAFDTMNHFFLSGQMIIPGSSYWNFGVGREIGEVEKDEEGLQTMKQLGQNMAWTLKKLYG